MQVRRNARPLSPVIGEEEIEADIDKAVQGIEESDTFIVDVMDEPEETEETEKTDEKWIIFSLISGPTQKQWFIILDLNRNRQALDLLGNTQIRLYPTNTPTVRKRWRRFIELQIFLQDPEIMDSFEMIQPNSSKLWRIHIRLEIPPAIPQIPPDLADSQEIEPWSIFRLPEGPSPRQWFVTQSKDLKDQDLSLAAPLYYNETEMKTHDFVRIEVQQNNDQIKFIMIEEGLDTDHSSSISVNRENVPEPENIDVGDPIHLGKGIFGKEKVEEQLGRGRARVRGRGSGSGSGSRRATAMEMAIAKAMAMGEGEEEIIEVEESVEVDENKKKREKKRNAFFKAINSSKYDQKSDAGNNKIVFGEMTKKMRKKLEAIPRTDPDFSFLPTRDHIFEMAWSTRLGYLNRILDFESIPGEIRDFRIVDVDETSRNVFRAVLEKKLNLFTEENEERKQIENRLKDLERLSNPEGRVQYALRLLNLRDQLEELWHDVLGKRTKNPLLEKKMLPTENMPPDCQPRRPIPEIQDHLAYYINYIDLAIIYIMEKRDEEEAQQAQEDQS